jgi:hypothetical protein
MLFGMYFLMAFNLTFPFERRHGANKPVITKALVKLDGPMFKCLKAVRRKWGYVDCY